MDYIAVQCHSRSGSSSSGVSDGPHSDVSVCNASVSCDKQHQPEQQADEASVAPTGLTRSELTSNNFQAGPTPLIGLSSPRMSGSHCPRKRKHKQQADNTDKIENGQASKRTREDHVMAECVPSDSQADIPQALSQSPVPIRSDIGVTTRSRTTKSTKKKKTSGFVEPHCPELAQADGVIGGDDPRSALSALRSRVQELEEERNDYRDSLRKETEKSMDRGRQLLLLQASTATAKQRANPTTTPSHDPPLNHRDPGPGGNTRPAGTSRRHEPPIGKRIDPGETEVPRDISMSFNSRVERQPQQQVKELGTRLSELESEAVDVVGKALRVLKYERRDEQFAAQCGLMRTEDGELAQATEEPTSDTGQALLRRAPLDETDSQNMPLDSTNTRLLRETNHHLSEKDREWRSVVAELQTDVRKLRKSLEVSVQSRNEVASTLRDANESHSREKVTLENRIRSLESDVAQAQQKIEQLNDERTSAGSLQDAFDESMKALNTLKASHARDRQPLAEGLARLGCKVKQLEAEKSSLANILSEVKQEFKSLKPRFLESQLQLRAAKCKISLLQTKVQDQEYGLWDAASKHAENVNALEARITELSGSSNKASAEVVKRDEELSTAKSKINSLQTMVQSHKSSLEDARAKHAEDFNTLEAKIRELSKSLNRTSYVMAEKDQELSTLRTYVEQARALQKTQENYQSIVDELAAKTREASQADAEIARLRRFEHDAKEHDRAIKILEQDHEEMFRQQQEQLQSLTEARQQIMLQRQRNEELGRRNDALERRMRELETTKSEHEARVTRFLQFVVAQTGRQIEEEGGELDNITDVGQPGDATLRQLGDRIQKKFDMLEHELQWYRNDRATIYSEYRRLEQWRGDLARNMAAALSTTPGPRQSRD